PAITTDPPRSPATCFPSRPGANVATSQQPMAERRATVLGRGTDEQGVASRASLPPPKPGVGQTNPRRNAHDRLPSTPEVTHDGTKPRPGDRATLEARTGLRPALPRLRRTPIRHARHA